MDETDKEYLHIRALLEEYNANIIVDDFVIAEGNRAVWLTFESDSDLIEIPHQILKAINDFNLHIVVFKIGLSHPIIYIKLLKNFYKTHALLLMGQLNQVVNLNKYVIKPDRLMAAMKGMAIEDKRRRICYGNRQDSQPRAKFPTNKKSHQKGK